MAAGAGLLLGSVAYDLIEEALKSSSLLWVAASFFLGSAVFVIGDLLLDHMGASKRKDPNGEQADGSSQAIVMGSLLDGIPESFVLGLTVLQGGVSVPLLVSVAISNLPRGHGLIQRSALCRVVSRTGHPHVAARRSGVGGGRRGGIRPTRPGGRTHGARGSGLCPGLRRRRAPDHADGYHAPGGLPGGARFHRWAA